MGFDIIPDMVELARNRNQYQTFTYREEYVKQFVSEETVLSALYISWPIEIIRDEVLERETEDFHMVIKDLAEKASPIPKEVSRTAALHGITQYAVSEILRIGKSEDEEEQAILESQMTYFATELFVASHLNRLGDRFLITASIRDALQRAENQKTEQTT